MFWEQPLTQNLTDRYGFNLDTEWLDGELISDIKFTVPECSGITVSNISYIELPTISAMFTGTNVGFWPVHVRVETPTRQLEFNITLWVRELPTVRC